MSLRTFAALLLLVALAACGGRSRDDDTPTAVTVLAPRFGDAAPHPWAGPTPADYPVHGIDASRFQEPIDWPAAAAAGVSFAFIKATEGGDRIDPMFADHLRGALRAGIPAGAYHFFYHCRPAAEQARWFIDAVRRNPGTLPPVLDVEWTPTSPTCTIRRPADTIRSEMAIFLDIVGRHFGQRPVIYTTLDFFHDNDLYLLGQQDFWVRSVAAHPNVTYPGQSWTFWQYTSTGLVPGIKGRADINAFGGSVDDWSAWLQARGL